MKISNAHNRCNHDQITCINPIPRKNIRSPAWSINAAKHKIILIQARNKVKKQISFVHDWCVDPSGKDNYKRGDVRGSQRILGRVS